MKANVIGVKRMFGTSKTGNQFDMCTVLIATPMNPQSGGKITVLGYGHEITEVPCQNEALSQFAPLAFPGVYELQLDQRPNRGELENVVTGISVLSKAA
jgi:hypothetical protein